MNVAELVHVRNELSHAKEVLAWFKSEEAYKYSTAKMNKKLIQKWQAKVDFWQAELNTINATAFNKLRLKI